MSPSRRQRRRVEPDLHLARGTALGTHELPEDVQAWHALLARRHAAGSGRVSDMTPTMPVESSAHATDPDPRLIAPDMSCRLLRSFLDVTAERFGHAFLNRVVQQAGLSVEWLEDANHWVSSVWLERIAVVFPAPPNRHNPVKPAATAISRQAQRAA